MTLHTLLDWNYDEDGDKVLQSMLRKGADPNAVEGPLSETALHVAVRRRRLSAAQILLDHGADIDVKTSGGKTAYAHAARRKFDEVAMMLDSRGADTALNPADRFAIAVVNGKLDEASRILGEHPEAVKTGKPEEDRLLADVAGRNSTAALAFLIDVGANLSATGLDSGTPLHQAAWFGQPDNARLLIDAGVPLNVFDHTHQSSPIGWAVHGSRYSGGAAQRQEKYTALVHMLLDAGSSLHYPDDAGGDAYLSRLIEDASPEVADILRNIV